MNTHDKIDLPPLPEWIQEQMPCDTKYPVSTMVTAMKQYAKVAIKAALQSQDREGVYIPERMSEYVASPTDDEETYAKRDGYVEGWNDCRQEAIDHARRTEGEGE